MPRKGSHGMIWLHSPPALSALPSSTSGPAHSVQSWCGQLLNISMGVAACKARGFSFEVHARPMLMKYMFIARTESYVTGQCEHGCGKSKLTDQDSSSLSIRELSVSLSRIAKYLCPMLRTANKFICDVL